MADSSDPSSTPLGLAGAAARMALQRRNALVEAAKTQFASAKAIMRFQAVYVAIMTTDFVKTLAALPVTSTSASGPNGARQAPARRPSQGNISTAAGRGIDASLDDGDVGLGATDHLDDTPTAPVPLVGESRGAGSSDVSVAAMADAMSKLQVQQAADHVALERAADVRAEAQNEINRQFLATLSDIQAKITVHVPAAAPLPMSAEPHGGAPVHQAPFLSASGRAAVDGLRNMMGRAPLSDSTRSTTVACDPRPRCRHGSPSSHGRGRRLQHDG